MFLHLFLIFSGIGCAAQFERLPSSQRQKAEQELNRYLKEKAFLVWLYPDRASGYIVIYR